MKKANPFKRNKYEIIWHIINAGLSGFLVLLGAISTGTISRNSFTVAGVAAVIVFVTKMKDYWEKEQGDYSKMMFSFVTFK